MNLDGSGSFDDNTETNLLQYAWSLVSVPADSAVTGPDGCALRGAPDGNGPGGDWITTCSAQEQVYTPLTAALAAIMP